MLIRYWIQHFKTVIHVYILPVERPWQRIIWVLADKGKVDRAAQESAGGCSSPSSRPWAHRWRTTNVRRQTYGYLPSCKASPPIGWYQIILLGHSSICPGLHLTAGWLGFEPAAYNDRKPSTLPLCHRATLFECWQMMEFVFSFGPGNCWTRVLKCPCTNAVCGPHRACWCMQDLHCHLEECLSRNLRARCSPLVSQVIETIQTELTGAWIASLPPANSPTPVISLSVVAVACWCCVVFVYRSFTVS